MKSKNFLKLIVLIVIMFTFNYYGQESIIPGWPCSPDIQGEAGAPSTITLNVLLVEFQDVRHRQPNAYTFNDFNNLLFSTNTYVSPNKYSPDGESVFGSVADYFRIMSNNNITITGSILNHDENNDNVPDWILLDKTKQFYNNTTWLDSTIFCAAREKAVEAGLDTTTNETTFLVIVYAGHMYRTSTRVKSIFMCKYF